MIRLTDVIGFSGKNTDPNKDNEDAIVILPDKNLFAVLDGATGQGGLDGKMASETFKNMLESKKDESLLAVVERANHELACQVVTAFKEKVKQESIPSEVVDQYRQALAKKKMELGRELSVEEQAACIEPAYSTATCGAIIQIDPKKEKMEMIQTGDCMVAVQKQNNEIELLTEDLISRSDYYSYVAYQKKLREKIGNRQFSLDLYAEMEPREWEEIQRQVREEIKPVLRKGRRNANNPTSKDGYPVFNGTPLDLKKYHKTIELKNVRKIALLSDGLLISQPELKRDARQAWQETAEVVFKGGPELLRHIVNFQASIDPISIRYPDRLKARDDQSGIFLTIERVKEKSNAANLLKKSLELQYLNVGEQSILVRAQEGGDRGR